VIEVQVRLYANLRQYRPGASSDQGEQVLVLPGSTVLALMGALGIPIEKVRTVFVNRRVMAPEAILQGGDRVDLFPAIAGG
jgi:sulfur carrier protein ThiS